MLYFEEYQAMAYNYAIYPKKIGYAYATLGLVNEAGEVAGKVKKMYRDNLTESDVRDKVSAELGDVLWYLAAVASEFDLNLDDIALANLEKLESRRERGVIGGSGDDR